jgi:hypothetical protein
MMDLRNFVALLGDFDESERAAAVEDRQAELAEQAKVLRARSYQAWKSPKKVGGFSLAITGAAWSIASGNPVPAILATLAAGLGMLPDDAAKGSAYSYLFAAQTTWPRS